MNIYRSNKGAVTKFILLIIVFVIIIAFAIKEGPALINLAEHPEDVRKYMLSIGMLGYVLFMLIQIAHVIIAVIPGDILYVLGGFVFGIPAGFIMSLSGVMIGSVIVFSFSRLLGYDFVRKVLSKEKIDKLSSVLNSSTGMFGLFVICLIPIIPKDPLMYVAGLTPVKASRLFIVYALSRIPVTLMWVAIGANAYDKNYSQMFIAIALLALVVLTGILLEKRVLKKNKLVKI